ncbi:Uncharacterized protein QTN25_006761 [Entamoeba marina]
MSLVIITLWFLSSFAIEDWTDLPNITPLEKIERAYEWSNRYNLLIEEYKADHPNEPFIRAGILKTTASFFPEMQMIVITTDTEYDVKYSDSETAPKLNLKTEKDGVESITTFTYHLNTVDDPLPNFKIGEYYFFPLPDYVKSYSFISGEDYNTTKSFVAFISYPTSSTQVSNQFFGHTIKSVQLIGPTVDSNEWNFTGNVIADYDLDFCGDYIRAGYQTDYESALNAWSSIQEITGWGVGQGLSLLMTFSFDGFFCFGQIDYAFLSSITKISTDWEHCPYYAEDSEWGQDPCCNFSLSSECNTFKERASIYIAQNSICNWDWINYWEKNLTIYEIITLNQRSVGMQYYTQYFHDFHFDTLPTIYWRELAERDKLWLECENILYDLEKYYDEFGECPFDFTGIEGFEPLEGNSCYSPTKYEFDLFLTICTFNYNETTGMMKQFKMSQLGNMDSFLENKTETIVVDQTDPNICYSLDGTKYIAEVDNLDCSGWVCDGIDDKRVFYQYTDAIAYCPELISSCAIPPSGCALGQELDTTLFPYVKTGLPFSKHVNVYNLTQEDCESVHGVWLDDLNITTDNAFDCLSQVVGCTYLTTPLFGNCPEKALFYNFYHWKERTLPTAEIYGLSKYDQDTEVSYLVATETSKTNIEANFMETAIELVKENVWIAFEYYNREVGNMISQCMVSGKYGNDLTIEGRQLLTAKTKNRVKNSTYGDVTLQASREDGTELTIYEYDRCYGCGSDVIAGITEGSLHLAEVNEIPLLTIWDDSYWQAFDNLAVRSPVFFNDTIEGVDHDFPIAYIMGDGVQFQTIEGDISVDLYLGIGELETVGFDERDVFQYVDFVRVKNNTFINYKGKQSNFSYELMYLDCLLSSSDENKLAFQFDSTFHFCKIPKDVMQSIDEFDMLFPVLPFIRYRRKKGRRMLKLFEENDLSSLGGPLLQYE